MGSLREAKLIGGLGALLSLLDFLPHVGIPFSVLGALLIIVAVKYIADEVRDYTVFRDILIGVIAKVLGAVVALALVVRTAINTIFRGFKGMDLIALLVSMAAAVIVAWVFLIVGSVYVKKGYDKISRHTGVGLFGTAATLYLIGSLLLILLVGALLVPIAKILELAAYLSLPEEVRRPYVVES